MIGHRGKPGMKAPLEVVPHAGNKACLSIDLCCLSVLLIQSHFFSRNIAYNHSQYACDAAALLDKSMEVTIVIP